MSSTILVPLSIIVLIAAGEQYNVHSPWRPLAAAKSIHRGGEWYFNYDSRWMVFSISTHAEIHHCWARTVLQFSGSSCFFARTGAICSNLALESSHHQDLGFSFLQQDLGFSFLRQVLGFSLLHQVLGFCFLHRDLGFSFLCQDLGFSFLHQNLGFSFRHQG